MDEDEYYPDGYPDKVVAGVIRDEGHTMFNIRQQTQKANIPGPFNGLIWNVVEEDNG